MGSGRSSRKSGASSLGLIEQRVGWWRRIDEKIPISFFAHPNVN
jgi:hypothetical protein